MVCWCVVLQAVSFVFYESVATLLILKQSVVKQ